MKRHERTYTSKSRENDSVNNIVASHITLFSIDSAAALSRPTIQYNTIQEYWLILKKEIYLSDFDK